MSRAAKAGKCRPPKTWRGEFVYKYGNVSTPERLGWLEDTILKNQIYIPKPGELNDRKEARPKIAEASIEQFIKTLFVNFIKSQPPMSAPEQAHHRKVIDFNLRRFGVDWVIESFEKGLSAEFTTQRIYSLTKRP